MTPAVRPAASPAAIWLALTTVYVVWGSTYLAIRVIVAAGLPPLLSMGARFLAAAVLLGAVLAIWGDRPAGSAASGPRRGLARLRVSRREALASGVMGALLLLGGNGLVAVAEQTVPSGLTALLVATTPLWLVLFRLAVAERPRTLTWAGVLVGFAGVAALALRGGGIDGVAGWGVVVVVVATLSWAVGSFLSGRLGLPRDPLVATTWEMALGGLALTIAGFASGEGGRLADLAEPDGLATRGVVAWVYLVTVGSMLAYSAYVWLLANAPISLVATYAYVNPVVAVLLGWLLLAEPVTAVVLVGGALVVAGVALVVGAERPRRAAADPATAAGAAAAPIASEPTPASDRATAADPATAAEPPAETGVGAPCPTR